MKRLTWILTLLCLTAPLAGAQGRHELQVSLSGPESGYLGMGPDTRRYGLNLADLYEPSEWLNPGTGLSLDYVYAFRNWLKPGIGLNWGMIWGYRAPARATGSWDRDEFARNRLTLLPQVSLFALDKPHFKLYGKLAAGGTLSIGTDNGTHLLPAWEVIPLGIQWGGQKIFGLAEIGYGNVYIFRIGLGRRW